MGVAIMAENAPTRTPEEIAKEYDLLPKLVTHLDRHLIFPLLQFLEGQDEEEPSEDVTRTKYELLKKTNMTDYVASLYCELEGLEDAPAEFATKRGGSGSVGQILGGEREDHRSSEQRGRC